MTVHVGMSAGINGMLFKLDWNGKSWDGFGGHGDICGVWPEHESAYTRLNEP
jgi:hypothetical protein